MSALDEIPIRVETGEGLARNALPVLHELRHALQDQYLRIHDALPGDVSDFDDRRLAGPDDDLRLRSAALLVRAQPGHPGRVMAVGRDRRLFPGAPRAAHRQPDHRRPQSHQHHCASHRGQHDRRAGLLRWAASRPG